MTQLGFYIDQTRCTGCYTCAVACKDWNDIHDSQVNWMRIKTIEEGKFPDIFVAYLPSPCYHCEEAACIKACPEGAIDKSTSNGIVTVDAKTCVGNRECHAPCLKACPWDAPQFGPEENAKMQKCNFCVERIEDDQKPICVEACPMYAIDAGPLEDLQKKYGKKVHAEGFVYSERFKPSIIHKIKGKEI